MIIGRDKYRFYICTDGTNFYPVLLVKPVTISGEKQEKLGDFRRKSSEWKLERFENVTVYNAIIAKIASPSTQTTKIQVKVELWDNWIDFTSIEFEGYVPIGSIKSNQDEGILQFTPEDESIYTWWDEHKEDSKNLIAEPSVIPTPDRITIEDTSIPTEYYLPLSLACEHFKNFFVGNHSDSEANGLNIQHWTDAKGTYYFADELGPIWRKEGWVVRADIWKFYYCIQTHVPNTYLNKPLSGLHWTEYWTAFDDYPYDNAVYHVIQQRSEFHLPNFVRGNGIYQPMFTKELGDNLEATNCPENKYCYGGASVVAGLATISDLGNIPIANAINFFLTGSGMTFYSDFFSLATNPVTGLPNKLTNQFLSHKAYLKGTNEENTKGEITLEALISALCDEFNCQWYIDPINENFVFEHIKFFENGKQYADGTPGIYTDLTDKTKYPALKYQTIEDVEGNPTDNEFSLEKESPQKETFKLSDTVDLVSEIKYDSAFCKKGETEQHVVGALTTDIAFVISYPDKSSDDTYCHLACDANKTIYRRDFTQGMTIRVFEDYANGDLMYDNLIRDFWIHDRHMISGKINLDAAATTFETQKKTKLQREIIFPRVEAGRFDPAKLITTNIGNGEVKSFEINTDTDRIKVSLLYEMG